MRARRLFVFGKGMSIAQVLDMLFAPGLQEVCLDVPRAPALRGSPADYAGKCRVNNQGTVCKLLVERGSSEFAFEASYARLAWRRWPPAGTPAWAAAREGHAAALQYFEDVAREAEAGVGSDSSKSSNDREDCESEDMDADSDEADGEGEDSEDSGD